MALAHSQEQEALSRSVFIPAAGDCWLSRMLGARQHTESCSRPNLTLQQWVDPKPKQRNEAGLWRTSSRATGTESWFLGCFLKLCCWRPKKQNWIWLSLAFISLEREFWCWAATSAVARCPLTFYCYWMSCVFKQAWVCFSQDGGVSICLTGGILVDGGILFDWWNIGWYHYPLQQCIPVINHFVCK